MSSKDENEIEKENDKALIPSNDENQKQNKLLMQMQKIKKTVLIPKEQQKNFVRIYGKR